MTERVATFAPAPDDATLWELRVPESLAPVIGRFAPARQDRQRHAFVLAAEHVAAFRAFASLHSIQLTDPASVAPPRPTNTPAPYIRERRDPGQDATNREGIRKVRKALQAARDRNAPSGIVQSWEDW